VEKDSNDAQEADRARQRRASSGGEALSCVRTFVEDDKHHSPLKPYQHSRRRRRRRRRWRRRGAAPPSEPRLGTGSLGNLPAFSARAGKMHARPVAPSSGCPAGLTPTGCYAARLHGGAVWAFLPVNNTPPAAEGKTTPPV